MKNNIYLWLFSYALALSNSAYSAASSSCDELRTYQEAPIFLRASDKSIEFARELIQFSSVLQDIISDVNDANQIPIEHFNANECTMLKQLFNLRAQSATVEELFAQISAYKLTSNQLRRLFMLGDYLDCETLIMQALAHECARSCRASDFENEDAELLITHDNALLLAEAIFAAHKDISLVPQACKQHIFKQHLPLTEINDTLLRRIKKTTNKLGVCPLQGASRIISNPDSHIFAENRSWNRYHIWGINLQSEADIRIWNRRTGELLQTLPIRQATSLIFSPDNQLLALKTNEAFQIWNPLTGEQVGSIADEEGDDYFSESIGFNGRFLAIGASWNALKVWDVQTGNLLHRIIGHEADVIATKFSPDGTILASCSRDNTVKIWNSHTGTLINTIRSTVNDIPHSIAFNADGTKIAIGGQNGSVQIWHTLTRELLHTLQKHHWLSNLFSLKQYPRIDRIEFNHDGTTLITISQCGIIHVWDLKTGELLNTVEDIHYNSQLIFDYRATLSDAILTIDEQELLFKAVQKWKQSKNFIVHSADHTYQNLIQKLPFLDDAALFTPQADYWKTVAIEIATATIASALGLYGIYQHRNALQNFFSKSTN